MRLRIGQKHFQTWNSGTLQKYKQIQIKTVDEIDFNIVIIK